MIAVVEWGGGHDVEGRRGYLGGTKGGRPGQGGLKFNDSSAGGSGKPPVVSKVNSRKKTRSAFWRCLQEKWAGTSLVWPQRRRSDHRTGHVAPRSAIFGRPRFLANHDTEISTQI